VAKKLLKDGEFVILLENLNHETMELENPTATTDDILRPDVTLEHL